MNFRLSFVAVCFLATMAVNMIDAKTLVNSSTVPKDIIVVKDIHDFIKNNPEMKLVRMTKEARRLRNQSVQYSLGARVQGDRLVGQESEQFTYPAKKDATIQLTYPEYGTGSIVTFVGLTCNQDSEDGNAYIVDGGIGQRFISIVVEANETENFSYKALYYGIN